MTEKIRRIAAILLTALIVLSFLPQVGTHPAYAADKPGDMKNVKIYSGVITWDAYEGAVTYCLDFEMGEELLDVVECKETYFDIDSKMEDLKYATGTYTVRLYAWDSDYEILTNEWTGVYQFNSPYKQLKTPQNVKWSGLTATWDAVKRADKYLVRVYREDDDDYPIKVFYVTENKWELKGSGLKTGRNYAFTVRAETSKNYANSAFSEKTAYSGAIKSATVTGGATQTYTGVKIPLEPVVKIAGMKLVKDTDYTLSYKRNRSVGTASVIITGIGDFKGSTYTKTFKIRPLSTYVKKVSRGYYSLTVKWARQKKKMASSRISGYQIQVATNKAFTKNRKTVKVTGYLNNKKIITGLKRSKTYYVRIRTYKTVGGKKYYSAWSAVKTEKTY